MWTNLDKITMEYLPDPNTDRRLLPPGYRSGDNSRRMQHCKTALDNAMNICISKGQREQLELYHLQGMTKTAIARQQGRSASTVSKSMRAAESAVRAYMALYMEIYDKLEREFLQEEL